ncbi:alginate lyase family protein [Pelagibius sp. 7325]|uniref:alginate lyase family protein n=1 Tax=Pelagibius sp. 7325 TaxID=3131994 RepID=UPI0030ED48C5
MSVLRKSARLVVVATIVLAGLSGPAQAYLTPRERQALDLPYEVRDPNESFFDVAKRMALLRETEDPMLQRIGDSLQMGLSCRSLKARPVLDGQVTLPSFYDNPEEWDLTVEPLLFFEETMSDLAGAWVASGDRYYADCLLDILESWAKKDALYEFDFDPSRPQAWYGIESMIFSAALALSTVTGQVEIDPQRRKLINDWLVRTAKKHFDTPASNPSCCNNHYYRRALYMTAVGVVADNDAMFRTGLRSVHSALDDIGEDGALQLAMRRGWRAIHYQNYSLLYLTMTMQIAYRQGYDLFSLRDHGRGFQRAVAFLLRSLQNPYAIDTLPPGDQDMSFTNDNQYFAWMEIWLTHFDNPPMERLAEVYRPMFNRGAGGYLTLYFKRPSAPQGIDARQVADLDKLHMTVAGTTGRYPLLEKWRRSQ